MDAEPRIERGTIGPLLTRVLLDGRERIKALQGGTYRRDQGVYAVPGGERAHGAQNLVAQLLPLVLGRH